MNKITKSKKLKSKKAYTVHEPQYIQHRITDIIQEINNKSSKSLQKGGKR